MIDWANGLVLEKWLCELVNVMKEIRDELQEINRNMEDLKDEYWVYFKN